MAKFKIYGADAETGAQGSLTVTADCIEDAEAIASGRKMFVSRIVEIEEVASNDLAPMRQQPMAHAMPLGHEAGHSHNAPTINVNLPRRGSSLGLASVILGILAFLICWIPFVSLVGLLLGGLGLLLGGAGFVISLSRRGASIGLPVAGSIVCFFAVAIAFVTGVVPSMALSQRAANMAKQNAAVSNTPSAGRTPNTSVPTSSVPGSSFTGSSVPPSQPDIHVTKIGEVLESERLRLGIKEARLDTLHVKRAFGDGEEITKDKYLVFRFTVTNLDANRRIHEAFAGITVTDEHGNNYESPDFGSARYIVGTTGYFDLRPNELAESVEVVERPIESARWLDIEIRVIEKDSSMFDRKPALAKFNFRIATNQIHR